MLQGKASGALLLIDLEHVGDFVLAGRTAKGALHECREDASGVGFLLLVRFLFGEDSPVPGWRPLRMVGAFDVDVRDMQAEGHWISVAALFLRELIVKFQPPVPVAVGLAIPRDVVAEEIDGDGVGLVQIQEMLLP